MQLGKILLDGRSSAPLPGDRVVYDSRSGYVVVHRPRGDIQFVVPWKDKPVSRLFLGCGLSATIARACAEHYARLGGLIGDVQPVKAAFPGLQIFEVVQ
jgi:hypothetical protein